MARFLYNILENEEEAFFLMLGLFENGGFSSIYYNDLAKLKQYFYVLERLIKLYLPELHAYFSMHKTKPSFFCSAWFVTMFTGTLIYSSEVKEPKIILRIWDEFILVNYLT